MLSYTIGIYNAQVALIPVRAAPFSKITKNFYNISFSFPYCNAQLSNFPVKLNWLFELDKWHL